MASYNITLELNSVSPVARGCQFDICRSSDDPGITLVAVSGVLLNGIDGNSIDIPNNVKALVTNLKEDEWVCSYNPQYIITPISSRSSVSAMQNILNNTVTGVTVWDTSLPATQGDISYLSGVFTFNTSALYDLDATFSFPANVTGIRQIWFQKNSDTSTLYGVQNINAITGGIPSRINIKTKIYFSASDTCQLFAYQTSGSTLSCGGGNLDPNSQTINISKIN